MQSYPLRVRGLKLIRPYPLYPDCSVVSFTGTWIETSSLYFAFSLLHVVSFTGTWIETFSDILDPIDAKVVSFTGTWIETLLMFCIIRHN